jgi:hypothetical protein
MVNAVDRCYAEWLGLVYMTKQGECSVFKTATAKKSLVIISETVTYIRTEQHIHCRSIFLYKLCSKTSFFFRSYKYSAS